MKGYLRVASLALLVACYATTATAQSCGIPADRLAHPTDCAKYYQLSMYTCPEGTLFNSKTDQCEAPENVTCGEATEPPSTTTTDAWTTATQPPTTDAWTGTTIIITSTTTDAGTDPTGTAPPTTDGWTDPTRTETPTTDGWTGTTTITTTTSLPTEENTTDATWVTSDGTSTSSTPSSSTELPTEGTPDPNWTTTSSPIPTEGTTTIGTTAKPEGPERSCPATDDPNNRVRYAHETECFLYYLCENGGTKLYQCVKQNNVQLHFNPYKKICQPVNEAGCDRCPDVEVAGEVVRLPHESICDYYYRCEDSIAYLYRCPVTGDHFSRIDRLCLLPEQAWCRAVME